MTRSDFTMIFTLVFVLSVPAFGALADGDDHGQDGNPSQVDNHGHNDGDGDHGNNNQNNNQSANPPQVNNQNNSNNNQNANPPQAGNQGNHGGEDDHGNNNQNTNPPQVNNQNNNDENNEPQNENQENQNQANQPQQNVQRLQANLAATPAGTVIDASGNIDIRAQGQEQRLKVEIQANVPDGTMFNVLANGMQVGTLTVRFNEAELEIEAEGGTVLPGGLTPGSVTMITVSDMNGAVVLQAQFGAVAPGAGQPGAQPAPERETVALMSTAQGMSIAANGQVTRRIEGQRQRLEVEVEAHVLDGTVFKVLADGIQIGSLTFRLQEAEFQLESENAALPSGLTAIDAIKTVSVNDSSGKTVLSANL